MYTIDRENSDDLWEVENLYDTCFAPGRELLSSYRLRDDVDPVAEICLLVRDENAVLAAAIRFWPVQISGHGVLLLGPIAVHPTRQGEGLGALLMEESLNGACNLGWKRVLLVGDAPYYHRFGFTPLAGVIMPPPTNPDRILGRALIKGAWDGIFGTVTKFSD